MLKLVRVNCKKRHRRNLVFFFYKVHRFIKSRFFTDFAESVANRETVCHMSTMTKKEWVLRDDLKLLSSLAKNCIQISLKTTQKLPKKLKNLDYDAPQASTLAGYGLSSLPDSPLRVRPSTQK